MSFSVFFDPVALEFLAKNPRDLCYRIIKKLEVVSSDPHAFFVRLRGRPEYKLRVGDYRVIADLRDGIILVRLIGHRKSVYDSFQA